MGSPQVYSRPTPGGSQYAGLCRGLPWSAGLCRVLPWSAGLCRVLPWSAGLCRVLPLRSAVVCRCLPGSAVVCAATFLRHDNTAKMGVFHIHTPIHAGSRCVEIQSLQAKLYCRSRHVLRTRRRTASPRSRVVSDQERQPLALPDPRRVSIRRTRLARLAKGFVFTMLAQFVDAVCVIVSIFMPLPGGIGSQTLVLTGSANTYHGERGIGKSSLMYFAELIAKGTLPAWHNGQYDFVTLNVELDPNSSFTGILHKIGSELRRRLEERSSVPEAAKVVWEFLKKWEAFGVRYDSTNEVANAPELVEELCDTIVSAWSKLSNSADGILVLIDEADKAGADAHLGEFIKVFTERLTRRQCNNVSIGVSGISSVIGDLKRSHESSIRILNHVLLEPLLMGERLEVISKGIAESNQKSENKVSIVQNAADWIAQVSEGYPHFIQQYAYSAFETNTDDVVDIEDVHFGAYKDNGALDQLGSRYFEDMYLGQINSDEYRRVLQVMAESPDEFMTRRHIKEATELKETTLTNALAALKKKRIILPHRERKGLYKLPTTSFAVWIRARSRRDAESQARRL